MALVLVAACDENADKPSEPSPKPSATASAAPVAPLKVDFSDKAMGTTVHMIAFTTPKVDEAGVRKAMVDALAEIRRLEKLMSSWRTDSDIGRVNASAGDFVQVSPETMDVIAKSLWAGKVSEGTFDVTFEGMSKLWKFGDAAEDNPKPPTAAQVAAAKKHVDYRRVDLDRGGDRVRIGKDQRISLGGIAKGYAVDAAAKVLKKAGVTSFLVQAGGDLYGAGKKPDGSPWVSGIRDPRGSDTEFFATIELTDHAFSTAGDYARAYIVKGKRYHHIIDPRTGFPATASRSVTVWAPDAFLADAVDDAVFILGPDKGLELVESLDGVGAVIVDAKNEVHVSKRLKDKVVVLHPPTDGI